MKLNPSPVLYRSFSTLQLFPPAVKLVLDDPHTLLVQACTCDRTPQSKVQPQSLLFGVAACQPSHNLIQPRLTSATSGINNHSQTAHPKHKKILSQIHSQLFKQLPWDVTVQACPSPPPSPCIGEDGLYFFYLSLFIYFFLGGYQS